MSVKYDSKYFVVVSCRQNIENALKKEKIEQIAKDTYSCNLDNSIWINRFTDYDYVHEFSGVSRTPELGFSDLWDLLLNSRIYYNKMGALLIIEELYGENLLHELQKINKSGCITREQKRAIKAIKNYSLPLGAFHWVENKNLNEGNKRKVYYTWTKIESTINEMI